MSHYKPYPSYKDSGVEWLGDVPEGWEVKPLFSVASERSESNKGMVEDNLLSLSYGRIVQKDINTTNGLLPESFETYQIVHPGDTVFRLTDLQNDKRSLRTGLVKETGIITSAYTAAIPEKIDPVYFNNLLHSYDIQKVFYAMGGGMRQSLKFNDIKKLPMVLPKKDEQKTISMYIKKETSRIDTLVQKKTRFIELLKEKRQALITHAVTKGLDPNVKMKDSGVEWLGDVPEHWIVIQSRRLFEQRKDKAVSDDQQLTASQKHGIIFQKDFMSLENQKVVQVITGAEILKHVEPNDFVISMRSFQGGLELSNLSGSISSAYVMLIPRNQVEPQYFKYLFKSITYIQALQSTSDLVRDGQALRYENFTKVPLPTFSKKEQLSIAKFLDGELALIDTLVEKTTRSIDLLKERRSALITAAVTGKIDVRGEVSPPNSEAVPA